MIFIYFNKTFLVIATLVINNPITTDKPPPPIIYF